jgi:hydrogenase nickel incorporation protein HypB
MTEVRVVQNVLKANAATAAANRARFDRAGVLALNLMSAPGSGKTTLLQRTLAALAPAHRCAVLVGDLQTTRDADRLADLAAAVVQINTGRGCHLDAAQVAAGLDAIDLDDITFCFIENVGNMVCPAAFDLGEHRKVALLSTPEGEDKVAKYPTLFQAVHAIVLNKMDLAEILGFRRESVLNDLAQVNSTAPLFELSAGPDHNLGPWVTWILQQRQDRLGIGS